MKHTSEQVERQYCEEVATLVSARVAYFDTVFIWLNRYLSSTEFQSIKSLCSGRAWPEQREPMWGQPWWRCRLTLQRPRAEAFSYIESLGTRHVVSQTHFALDLTVDDLRALEAVDAFFARHWVQRWRPAVRVETIAETRYSIPLTHRGRNRTAQYSDRRSKISSALCTHLEWRCGNAAAVKQQGIRTVADLVGFDHRAFWKQKLQLRRIDFGRLGRRLQRTSRRQPRPDDVRIGYMAALAAAEVESDVAMEHAQLTRPVECVEAVKARWGAGVVRRCSVTIENASFLPE